VIIYGDMDEVYMTLSTRHMWRYFYLLVWRFDTKSYV